MSLTRAGVLVKYHPCSVYAREGSPCPYFKFGSKRCSKPPSTCEMPEYDKWFKDVLAGKIQSFPARRRIYLFKISGVPLFLYHLHEKKIVGEAAIVKVTEENAMFHYLFNEFLSYPNFIGLNEIKSDESLRRLTGKGRWNIKYLTKRTVKEVRNLSGLPTEIKEKLANKLQDLKQKIAEMPKPRYPWHGMDALAFAHSKLEQIKLKRQFDPMVLNKAYQIFSKATEKGLTKGRPISGLFYASLYAACRTSKKPISKVEIAKISDLTPQKIFSYYCILLNSLNLTVPTLSSKDFVMEYSKQLPISEETVKRAISFIESIDRFLLSGKNPRAIAAAALYIACEERKESVTQKQIGKVLRINPISIRNFLRAKNLR